MLSPQKDRKLDDETSKYLGWVKIIFIVFLLGLLVVGKRITFWPLVNWPMYSDWRTEFPAASKSITELRVTHENGSVQKLLPSDILPFDRKNVAEMLIEKAFVKEDNQSRQSSRVAIKEILEKDKRFTDIQAIEAWQVRWNVSPLKVPPLERNSPEEKILIGAFEFKDY